MRQRRKGGRRESDTERNASQDELIAVATARLAASLASVDTHWAVAVGLFALNLAGAAFLVTIATMLHPSVASWATLAPAALGTTTSFGRSVSVIWRKLLGADYGPGIQCSISRDQLLDGLVTATVANQKLARRISDDVGLSSAAFGMGWVMTMLLLVIQFSTGRQPVPVFLVAGTVLSLIVAISVLLPVGLLPFQTTYRALDGLRRRRRDL